MSIEVSILGCNSALPTSERHPSAQIVTLSGRTFLIDCGEGTQFMLRRMKVNFMRISHVFISHLHGDHVFGLLGLISTMSLLNRKARLEIFAHPKLEELMRPHLDFFCDRLTYEVVFHPLQTDGTHVIYSDKALSVESIALKHRLPTCGFIFRESRRRPNMRKDAIARYGLGISDIARILEGCEYKDSEGNTVDRSLLLTEAPEPASYAYCSDTQYMPDLAGRLRGVDTLYHEATFADDQAALAKATMHSTARQAATVARDAGVRRLLIGHYSSRYHDTDLLRDEARSVFADTIAVADGMRISIG